MSEAPERIWAVHHETQGAVMIGEWADTVRHLGGTEYVRADRIEELEAKLAKAEQALRWSVCHLKTFPMDEAETAGLDDALSTLRDLERRHFARDVAATPLTHHFSRGASFLASLEGKSPTELSDAFANEVMETGGKWTVPPGDYDPDSRALFEINLHGIVATGWTEGGAISTWIAMANAKRGPVIDLTHTDDQDHDMTPLTERRDD